MDKMAHLRTLQRGLHRIMQNLYVTKSRISKAKSCPAKPKGGSGGDRQLSSKSEEAKAAMWKKISIFGAFPTIGVVAGLVFFGKKDEPERKRPPFVKYEYMRKRNRRYPWGDGDRTFFHNPHVNALSNGYEDE